VTAESIAASIKGVTTEQAIIAAACAIGAQILTEDGVAIGPSLRRNHAYNMLN